MRFQIPQMLKGGGGSIVNCSSVAGLVGAPYLSAYVASKHGIIGLTKSAALEYAKRGIRVNAVCPAFIDTPLSRESLTTTLLATLLAELPIGRLAPSAAVATTVKFLLGSDSSSVTDPQLAIVAPWRPP